MLCKYTKKTTIANIYLLMRLNNIQIKICINELIFVILHYGIN